MKGNSKLKNALVVDDTKANRILLTKCLEQEGYTVTAAGSGKQALKLLQAEKFQIIFLDIKMPFMSGTEVFKWIMQNGIRTPVVVTTAYATVKNAVECTRMGAVAYLQKPFTLERFREILTEIELQIFGGNLAENGGNDGSGGNDRSAGGGERRNGLTAARRELERGCAEAALRHLKQALFEDPAGPEVYLLLSKAYALAGNAEYEEKFRKAYEAWL